MPSPSISGWHAGCLSSLHYVLCRAAIQTSFRDDALPFTSSSSDVGALASLTLCCSLLSSVNFRLQHNIEELHPPPPNALHHSFAAVAAPRLRLCTITQVNEESRHHAFKLVFRAETHFVTIPQLRRSPFVSSTCDDDRNFSALSFVRIDI